jgi:hypothetical protein
MNFVYSASKRYFVGQIIVYLCDLSFAQASHLIGVTVHCLFCQQVHTSAFYFPLCSLIAFSEFRDKFPWMLRQLICDFCSELCCRFVLKVFFSTSFTLAVCIFSPVYRFESLSGLHSREVFLIVSWRWREHKWHSQGNPAHGGGIATSVQKTPSGSLRTYKVITFLFWDLHGNDFFSQ